MNRPSRIFNIIIIKRDERNCDLHNLYKIMREIKKEITIQQVRERKYPFR